MHLVSKQLHLTFLFIFIFACGDGAKKSKKAVTEKHPKPKSQKISRDSNFDISDFSLGNLSGTVTYSGTGDFNIATGTSTNGAASDGTGLNGTWPGMILFLILY